MAYTLTTYSFGATYANYKVQIKNSVTGIPAVVLATATGGLISNDGIATLDSGGNLSVYLDSSGTWSYVIINGLVPITGGSSGGGGGGGGGSGTSDTTEATQLLVKAAVQAIQTSNSAIQTSDASTATSTSAVAAKLPSGTLADATEATQLLVKTAAQSTATSTSSVAAKLPSGNLSDATEATQLLVKAAVQSLAGTVSGGSLASNANLQVSGAPVTSSNPVPISVAGTLFYNSVSNNANIPGLTNSGFGQLAAGASFTGGWESAFNWPSIQIMGNSNQPMQYTIDQSIDGTNATIVNSTVFYRGAIEELDENLQINGNYVRITAKNLGAASTSGFQLNTTYGDLAALPQALSNSGNLKVASRETQNFTRKLRDNFQSWPNNNWTRVSKAGGDLILLDGNVAGCGYLVMSLDPLSTGTETFIESDPIYNMPVDLGVGIHTSQRTYGQELSVAVISNDAGAVSFAEVQILNIQQATTTLTINTSAAHGMRIGQRFGIYGVTSDSRLNYAALIVATTPTATQLTATAGPQGTIASLTVGPFSPAAAFMYIRDSIHGATNGTSMILENATTTNASFYVKAEGGDSTPIGGTFAGNHSATILTTASSQITTAALNYAFRPTDQFMLALYADRLQWSDSVVDTTSQSVARATFSQVVPHPDNQYVVRFAIKNRKGLTVPVAKIVSAVKTGTTTATVTTDVAHGLSTGDYINTYGARDQTNFANLTTATVVASIINSTSFTVVWGAAVTATSYGGSVARVQGQQVLQGAVTQSIQSATIASSILTLILSNTVSGITFGDYINIHGCRDAVAGADVGLDGIYRVRDFTGSTVILEPIGTTTIPTTLSTTNCGGTILKRTDLRISFVRLFDFERLRVELLPRPASDATSGAPIVVQGGTLPTVTTVGTVSTVTSLSQIAASVPLMTVANGSTNKALGISMTNALSNVDQSATAFAGAGRVNGTVVATANGGGAVISSEINVTAITLGTATSVVAILQESRGGTNFTDIWQSEPITATGIISTPAIPVAGRRRWCFHSIGGTSTTVTVTITTLELFGQYPMVRSFRDVFSATNPLSTVFNSATAVATTFVLTTLNTVTAPWLIEGSNALTYFITLAGGPTVTTQPIISVEFSMDGTNWLTTTNTITAAGNNTYSLSLQNQIWKFTRLKVTTAAVYSAGSYTITLMGVNVRG